jgi:transposase
MWPLTPFFLAKQGAKTQSRSVFICVYGKVRDDGGMPKPLSNDLRTRIIRFFENHSDYTQPEIAEEFGVSVSTVEKLLHRWRTTGSSDALPHGGGQVALLKEHETALQKMVAKQPDVTLEELQSRLKQQRQVSVSPPTICRALQKLKLNRKKVQTAQ